MKIIIVGFGSWHQKDVRDALHRMGHDVLLVDRYALSGWKRLVCTQLDRLSRRLRVVARVHRWCFARWTAEMLADFDPDAAIVWSSFLYYSNIDPENIPVILVRGSTHISRQNQVLSEVGKGPSPLTSVELLEYRTAKAVTVPTEQIASDSLWAGVRVIVAPYAFELPTENKHSASDPNHGPLKLVFVGDVGLRKGADRLQLFDQVPSVQSVLVIGRLRSELRSLVRHRKFRFIGQLPGDEVIRAMARCHAFVLLSREEGMARAGLEAAALGLPLLVTPETGLSYICDAGGGVIVPGQCTVGDLEAACDLLRRSWGSFSACAQAAVATSTWEAHVQNFVHLFEEARRSN